MDNLRFDYIHPHKHWDIFAFYSFKLNVPKYLTQLRSNYEDFDYYDYSWVTIDLGYGVTYKFKAIISSVSKYKKLGDFIFSEKILKKKFTSKIVLHLPFAE